MKRWVEERRELFRSGVGLLWGMGVVPKISSRKKNFLLVSVKKQREEPFFFDNKILTKKKGKPSSDI
jgi:hypothetical protein